MSLTEGKGLSVIMALACDPRRSDMVDGVGVFDFLLCGPMTGEAADAREDSERLKMSVVVERGV